MKFTNFTDFTKRERFDVMRTRNTATTITNRLLNDQDERSRGERALELISEAQVLMDSESSLDQYHLGQRLQAKATELMKPGEIVRGCGEAIEAGSDLVGLVDTLENPSSVGVGASTERLNLLADAGVLDLGVDAAQTIEAKNSIEKMAAHQISASHALAMKLASRAMDDTLPPVEQARFANASARMMTAFSEALLALQKLRTGGNQTIKVQHQHVHVNEGGQAIVAAGDISGGTR